MLPVMHATSFGPRQRGFTLVELLVSMAITTVVMGATMTAMTHAINATDSAILLTNMNNGLRTSMDLMVRDLLQVGQGLPGGHVVMLPTGAGVQVIRMPGPPGTAYSLPLGTTEISAVMPGPGLGPVIDGVATDIVTTLQVDSSFGDGSGDSVNLTAFDPNGTWVRVDPAINISNNGPDDIHPGDLIVLQKGTNNCLVEVTRVAAQQIFFDAADAMNLNQQAPPNGTCKALYAIAPTDAALVPGTAFVTTEALRVRMITYYIDNVTDPARPRLARRMNVGNAQNATVYDNTLGTAVAFDVENLQITYDLADSVTNPANVRMTLADINATAGGRCLPNPCSRNNIRKVNILMSGRSRIAARSTRQFLRNRLQTQVSLRSLAFVDRYQ
jgi:prepilin-type N-terminal cleavage/methylation domain-containing protein